jgi:hypothetical protein
MIMSNTIILESDQLNELNKLMKTEKEAQIFKRLVALKLKINDFSNQEI